MANAGSVTTAADVDFYSLTGQLIGSETLPAIVPNSVESVSMNFCCIKDVRAVVTGSAGTQLVSSQEVFDGSGRTVALMEEEEGIFSS